MLIENINKLSESHNQNFWNHYCSLWDFCYDLNIWHNHKMEIGNRLLRWFSVAHKVPSFSPWSWCTNWFLCDLGFPSALHVYGLAWQVIACGGIMGRWWILPFLQSYVCGCTLCIGYLSSTCCRHTPPLSVDFWAV